MHTLTATTEVSRAWLIPRVSSKTLVDSLPVLHVSPPDQLLSPTVQDPDEEALRRSR